MASSQLNNCEYLRDVIVLMLISSSSAELLLLQPHVYLKLLRVDALMHGLAA